MAINLKAKETLIQVGEIRLLLSSQTAGSLFIVNLKQIADASAKQLKF